MMNDYPSKQFWIEFLEMYKSLPALWKVKSKFYKSRALKNEGYEEMVCKLQEAFPSADREYVKKKINAMRTSYRRELARIKKAESRGDNYMPTLWYFSLIDFLRNQDNSTTIDSDTDENPNISIEEVNIPMQPPNKKIKRRPISLHDQPYKVAVTEPRIRLEESPFISNTESEIIARCWENEYNKLTPEQQMYAKKAIDDVLFEGRLGLLTKNSVMINAQPTYALITAPQNVRTTSGSAPAKDPPAVE